MQAIREKSLKNSDAFARAAPPGNFNAQAAATETIPAIEISENRYVARFARSADEIDRALRLRFEVFNLELREGLDVSFITGRDEDEFDATCHHLIVIEKSSNEIVGTYRLQTLREAKSAAGFYCAGEFDLESLPAKLLTESLEIGRACIARE
ncbi:MAG: GNAT family N-acetyltransferase, partial [Acidobacteria bacterium]|nr:GNAT family N-acetyltransferase [Acidobacteriota bacterium]